MAYRLADLKMYTPMEMSYHPGVPFYLMSWLALALTGHPLGSDGVALFNTMVDHIETFHLMMIFLAGLVGAAGIFIFARTAPGSSRATYYTYRSPFAQFGEGFVIDFASIPRLTEAYLESRPNVLNTLTASKSSKEKEVGTYVIDKKYFGSADLVQNAPNLDLLGSKPVRYREGDRVIELKTVFLLVRG
jgi:hypothetical protein